jgi:DNA-binding response OmpR family regulator
LERVRILLIEDDAKTAEALQRGLRKEGFEAVTAKTGEEGFFLLNAQSFDLVLLDWMLPGHDGIEILKLLRARGTKTPVMLLTARDAVDDRVVGLNCGADDYLIKPFAFTELLARIRALLRRTSVDDAHRLQLADLCLEVQTRRVQRAGSEIVLTPREFDLLAYLLRNPGQIVTRQMLAKDVWREPRRVTPIDNLIDVTLARLRKKIDDGHRIKLLHTIRGVGFVLRAEPIP